ncbi:MAG: PD40 domain-containing protein, partial [Deltaproteobacteria bacterium]|nr:PD40 domain-containing protein [Deltaproteobacteria bacterium]
TGRTYPELYEGFKSELRRRHGRQMCDMLRRGLREGVRLTFHGRNVYYPQFVPPAGRRAGPRAQDGPATAAGYALAYFRDDLHERSGIYELDLRPDGRPSGAAELLVARTSTASPLSFAPDGGMLFASEVPWRNVYQRTDLFLLAPGERAPSGAEPGRRRLTTGLRATAPSLSPDGRTVAFTVNARGTTSLGLARLGPDGPIEGRRTLVAGARFDQVYTPVFSPDGSRIALSTWSAGGFRDLRIVEVPSGRSVALMRDRALDTGPCWSPDGRTLYFASDRTGIFNIYAYSLADGTLRQVTNVRTGAFMPAVSPDQRWLVYVGYTGAGHDLYAMPLDPARFLAAPAARQERPDAPAEPPPVRWRRQRYDPLPTLRPYRYSFEYAPGSFGTNALTVRADGADVVGHHSMSAAVVADPGAPLPQLSLDYGYGRLPLDLSLQVSNRVAPRTDFRISDRTPQYVERSYGIRSGLSYTDNQEFGYQRGGVSYGASIVDRSLPVGTAIDPYAGLTSEPQRGLMAIVHLGYALSNVEGSFETAGAARGFSLGLSLDLADSATGSSESVYAASYTAALYLPMPWPGHQTLALRSRGGLSAGSYSRRGIFYVGGYDLERTSLLDTITSGILSGAFVLRGYPPNAYAGSTMMLQNAEYRIPLVAPDLGISTLPLYLRRVSGNLFFDHGGAFDRLDFEATEFLARGALLDSPQLHSAAGAELWLEATLAYYLDVQFRLGYARGFSVAALPGGQGYFVAAGAY